MIPQCITASSFESLSVRTTQAMEFVWLMVVFFVPLVFATTEFMANGYEVPKVTLDRSLVGILGALCIIELGLGSKPLRWFVYKPSLVRIKE